MQNYRHQYQYAQQKKREKKKMHRERMWHVRPPEAEGSASIVADKHILFLDLQ